MSSTTSASPSQTSASGNGANPLIPSLAGSALYLYIFLATLSILVVATGALVLRSMYSRRVMERAIRNGTWVPPPVRVRPTRAGTSPDALGEKPMVYEAWIGGKPILNERWDDLKPMWASRVHGNETVSASTETQATPMGTGVNVAPPPRGIRRFLGRSAVPSSGTALSLTPLRVTRNTEGSVSGPEGGPSTENPVEVQPMPAAERMQIAVLIAMPTRYPWSTHEHIEEQELPHIEFGVAYEDVAVRLDGPAA